MWTNLKLGAIAALSIMLACGGDDGGPQSRPDAGDEEPLGCDFDDPPCTGETLCISNNCEAAFGRVYRITVVSASVPTNNQGQDWDAGGGAPDLFAVIAVDDNSIGMTGTVEDQFEASWNQYVDTVIVAGNKLTIAVWDEDLSEHDLAFFCDWDPLTVEAIRAETLTCSGTAGTLSGTIVPK